jgi:hypothetical protein
VISPLQNPKENREFPQILTRDGTKIRMDIHVKIDYNYFAKKTTITIQTHA